MSPESLLPKIDTPSALKDLSLTQLRELALECRQTIINTVAQNGGHLASNLGVVELTIALAKTFDFAGSQDELIFDVGHQCYTWKLLSGRYRDFASLRQKNGLAGFPKSSESIYDFFNTGHSSTSISAALGIARAKKLQAVPGLVIALIGDGALGSGMAFEALNDAGQRGDRILIILNDNQKSIDDNVGGLAKHLEKLRISRGYIVFKNKLERFCQKIPYVGHSLLSFLRKIKALVRRWHRSQSIFFEQIGFKYYGPVDGHDLDSLLQHLAALKQVEKPTVLHVITRKGNGYNFAEADPSKYHGVAPFELDSGQSKQGSTPSYTAFVGQALLDLAAPNPRICAISAAMTSGTGLTAFAQTYPERFFDVGIAEQHAVTLAAGLAKAGLRPFVALYSTFAQRAIDQILHDVCLQGLAVCFLFDRAGLVPNDGETHQGLYDVALLQAFPNLSIFAPVDAQDIAACLKYAENSAEATVIRYPKAELPTPLNLNSAERDIFSPRRLLEGGDLTLVAFGSIAPNAIEAAYLLQKKGVNVELFSCICSNKCCLSGIIESTDKTGRLLIVEELCHQTGFANYILPQLLEQTKGFTYSNLAVAKLLQGQAGRSELLEDMGLDPAAIVGEVLRHLKLD